VHSEKMRDAFHALITLNTSAVALLEKAKNKLHKFYNPGQYKAPEERELTEEERLLRGAGQDIGDVTAESIIPGTTQKLGSQLSFVEYGSPSLPPPPETYGEHKNKSQKNSSVIALLNLMQNDLKSQTQAAEHAENTAQEDYDEMIVEAAKTRADATASIAEMKTAIAEYEASAHTAATDLTEEENILAELKEQEQSLHEECDFILAHFDERKEARTSEIEGLKTAKSVLSGANFQ